MVLQLKIAKRELSISWIEYVFTKRFKLPKKPLLTYEEVIPLLGRNNICKAVNSGKLNCLITPVHMYFHPDEVILLFKDRAKKYIKKELTITDQT